VRLAGRIEGTARLKGVLEDVQGDSLTVLDEDQHRRYTVRFGDVRLARLVPEL
jgi:ribosome maturation factor RimP